MWPQIVNGIRNAVGDGQHPPLRRRRRDAGSLLSNLQQGAPVIAAFNAMGYERRHLRQPRVRLGQTVLAARTRQATYPYVSANITLKDTGNCTTAGWTSPPRGRPVRSSDGRAAQPGQRRRHRRDHARDAHITIAAATAGLCFRDPYEAIAHYYAALDAAADVIVVLSHLGYTDGGYGYGFTVYGDQTLAAKLNTAGKPVNLIIGGHSHTNSGRRRPMVGSHRRAGLLQRPQGRPRRHDRDAAAPAVTVAWRPSRSAPAAPSTGRSRPSSTATPTTRPTRPSSTSRSGTRRSTCCATTTATT